MGVSPFNSEHVLMKIIIPEDQKTGLMVSLSLVSYLSGLLSSIPVQHM